MKQKEFEFCKSKNLNYSKKFVERLKKKANKNNSKKYRINIHQSVNDKIQEMIVVIMKNTRVREHFHSKKSETLQVIEGLATLIFFDKKGKIKKKIKLGDYKSGLTFFYKVAKNQIHTIKTHTKYFVFKETTSGPFNKSQSSFPKWSLQ